jgi:hypothetical protein
MKMIAEHGRQYEILSEVQAKAHVEPPLAVARISPGKRASRTQRHPTHAAMKIEKETLRG